MFHVSLKKLVEVNKSEVSYSMNELETAQLIKTDKASVQNTRVWVIYERPFLSLHALKIRKV